MLNADPNRTTLRTLIILPQFMKSSVLSELPSLTFEKVEQTDPDIMCARSDSVEP
jgi:hypothetical protein